MQLSYSIWIIHEIIVLCYNSTCNYCIPIQQYMQLSSIVTTIYLQWSSFVTINNTCNYRTPIQQYMQLSYSITIIHAIIVLCYNSTCNYCLLLFQYSQTKYFPMMRGILLGLNVPKEVAKFNHFANKMNIRYTALILIFIYLTCNYTGTLLVNEQVGTCWARLTCLTCLTHMLSKTHNILSNTQNIESCFFVHNCISFTSFSCRHLSKTTSVLAS